MDIDASTSFASTRRRFLTTSSLAVIGATVLGGGLASCSGGTTTAGAANFTTEQFELLSKLSDMLIPATDTPGAIGAGVPEFVERMMSDWAKVSTRDNIRAALTLLDERAREAKGGEFVSLSSADQIAILEQYETFCFSKYPALPDKIDGDGDDTAPDATQGYRDLKMLVYRGYYWSEIGCTQELQYELIPGPDARADAPMAEIGRSWAL